MADFVDVGIRSAVEQISLDRWYFIFVGNDNNFWDTIINGDDTGVLDTLTDDLKI